jgi:hypothetical protein
VIGAGLLASARCREFTRAALLSLVYSVAILFLLGSVQTVIFFSLGGPPKPLGPDILVIVVLVAPWVLCAGITEAWRDLGNTPVHLWASGGQVLLAALFLGVVLWHLNRHLRRLSSESGRSPRQEAWARVFATPCLFREGLRKYQRRILNRNPVGWLHCRTWRSRVSAWGWLGVAVVLETSLITAQMSGDLSSFREAQVVVFLLCATGLAFSAADSFRVERETGALELLLVTPLGVKQIILGRLLGIWGQYLLVFGLLMFVWLSTAWIPAMNFWTTGSYWSSLVRESAVTLFFFLSTFLLLPVVGLDQSLRRKHFVTSWLATLTFGLAIPLLVPLCLYGLRQIPSSGAPLGPEADASITPAILLQLGFALAAARRLYRVLDQRSFATAGPG